MSITRQYAQQHMLKYGCNPHQSPAAILSIDQTKLPFEILNGTPGYINLLDALNAWQLVKELKEATGYAAAASFKHVSPAGAAIATEISNDLLELYDAKDITLSPPALAYLKARQTDPKCSFGDFAAISDEIDETTANFLKREVSDGIIAPSYTPEALNILKSKKNGAFIILKAQNDYQLKEEHLIEIREIYGVAFMQRRNDKKLDASILTSKIVTKNTDLPQSAINDLIVASITAKYTQSNSVVYALHGQTIGVGAGQQSRVDCVKLAGSKAEIWWCRQHEKVKSLQFKKDSKRVDRTNARIAFIEGEMSEFEYKYWSNNFDNEHVPSLDSFLSYQEKKDWLKQLKGVSLSSDAFLPFRDNVDVCSRFGVQYIAHPGGSIQDAAVNEAADEYNMVMTHSGVRLFHH